MCDTPFTAYTPQTMCSYRHSCSVPTIYMCAINRHDDRSQDMSLAHIHTHTHVSRYWIATRIEKIVYQRSHVTQYSVLYFRWNFYMRLISVYTISPFKLHAMCANGFRTKRALRLMTIICFYEQKLFNGVR